VTRLLTSVEVAVVVDAAAARAPDAPGVELFEILLFVSASRPWLSIAAAVQGLPNCLPPCSW